MLDFAYLSYFCSEMSSVLKTGMRPADGLSLMAQNERDARVRAVLLDMQKKTDAGISVYTSMQETGVFPDYVLQMVRIAESTGRLDSVFASLAEYCDSRIRIARVIRSAVVYPAVLLVIMLAVLFVFLTEVLPVFNDVFTQLGASMSAAAKGFLNVGLALRSARWWILGVLAAIAAAAVVIRFAPSLRERFSAWVTRVFARSGVGRKIAAARFASALDLAFSGGVDLDEAVEMAQFFCSDPVMFQRVRRCRERLASGESIDDAFTAEEVFNPMCCHLLSIGVQTGTADSALADIARRTGNEMDDAVEKVTGSVEPVIVIVLSVCVGLLLLGVMLPLVGIMSAI